ncbi:MAG: hypothetical protein J1F35_00530 [Erysipelotrichales bacterium]|nr:hypothetical protein [Erysipelotrichales bacterium]
MNDKKIVIDVPKTENETVNKLINSYLELKKHEFTSIINKLSYNEYSFKNIYEEHNYLNYKDLHIILYYNYGYRLIREDKFFHTLDDKLIDINHFTNDITSLKTSLKESLNMSLKEYKINESMIDYSINFSLDNFLVFDDGLEFIFSLNQFGIDSNEEIRIKVKEFYYE